MSPVIHDYEGHPPKAQLGPYSEPLTPPALPSPVILLRCHHTPIQPTVSIPRSVVDTQPSGAVSGALIGRGQLVLL